MRRTRVRKYNAAQDESLMAARRARSMECRLSGQSKSRESILLHKTFFKVEKIPYLDDGSYLGPCGYAPTQYFPLSVASGEI